MHPDMASALASQHRHEMTAKASHHAQATLAAQPGETAEARLPRYRVSWSRTALSTAAADGARRGRSWVIVISATRGF